MSKPIEDGEYKEKVENKLQNKIIKDYEEEEIEVDDDNDSCAISTGQKLVDVDFHPSKQIKEDNFLSEIIKKKKKKDILFF